MNLNLSFEQYLLLSEDSKKELEKSLEENLSKLENFSKKERDLKAKESLTKIEKDMLKTYKESHIHLSEYEGFSVHNYTNVIRPSFTYNKGYIIFLTKKELSPVEEYGLVSLFHNCLNHYKNFNISAEVYKGRYIKNYDKIVPTINEDNEHLKTLTLLCISQINNKGIELTDNMVAYYLHYKSEIIENNNGLIKKKNKPKFNFQCNFIIE